MAIKSLDLALLQAGAGMKGEFENRLKNLVKEVNDAPQPIILFIDEAHGLIGGGGQAGQGDAANILKQHWREANSERSRQQRGRV